MDVVERCSWIISVHELMCSLGKLLKQYLEVRNFATKLIQINEIEAKANNLDMVMLINLLI